MECFKSVNKKIKMKAKYTLLMLCCMISFVKVSSQSSGDVMSEKYRDIWNDQVQKKIDADIERNRKANAVLKFENLREILTSR